MRNHIFTVLLFLLIPVHALFADTESQKDEILSNIYKRYGGINALLAVKDVIQKGSGFSVMENKTAKITRIYKYPMNLKIIKEFSKEDSEIRIVTDTKSYRNGKEVNGILKDSMMLQASRIMTVKLMLENRQNLVYIGEKEVIDSKKWHIFSYSLGTVGDIIIQVDPQNYMIKATIGILFNKGQQIRFITTYDNFKKIDGLLIATKESHYAMGNYVGYTLLDHIEFNNGLEETLFRP